MSRLVAKSPLLADEDTSQGSSRKSESTANGRRVAASPTATPGHAYPSPASSTEGFHTTPSGQSPQNINNDCGVPNADHQLPPSSAPPLSGQPGYSNATEPGSYNHTQPTGSPTAPAEFHTSQQHDGRSHVYYNSKPTMNVHGAPGAANSSPLVTCSGKSFAVEHNVITNHYGPAPKSRKGKSRKGTKRGNSSWDDSSDSESEEED